MNEIETLNPTVSTYFEQHLSLTTLCNRELAANETKLQFAFSNLFIEINSLWKIHRQRSV